MSDNIQLNQNSSLGAVVATENIGSGIQCERIKVVIGPMHTDGGDVSSSNPLPVQTLVPTFTTGRKSLIGTAAVQLTVASTSNLVGVQMKADAGNAGKIYVGSSSGVTANVADATDGLQLAPGEALFLPINNANIIYLIADTGASNTIFWMAL